VNTRRGLGRLAEHRRIRVAKPVLADVYAIWFEALLGALSVERPRAFFRRRRGSSLPADAWPSWSPGWRSAA